MTAKSGTSKENNKKSKTKKSSSNLVAAGILLSRIAGLVREQVIVVALSSSKAASAFRFAMRIPNLLQNLLGEGALSASFIPVYAKLIEKKETEKANNLAKTVVSILIFITTILVLLFILTANWIVRVFTAWEQDPELLRLTTEMIQITSLGIGFLVISAWCLGVLNSHRHFFLSYVAPVIWNFTQIVALIVAITYGLSLDQSAITIAWAVVIGGFLQLLVQLPKTIQLLHKDNNKKAKFVLSPELKDVSKRFIPAVGARGIVQISSYVDTFLAAALVISALPIYTAAMPIYILPISLFGFSVAAAELTEMSRINEQKNQIKQRLTIALRKVAVPAGFVTVAYITASKPIIQTLYGIPAAIKDQIVSSSSSSFGSPQIIAISIVLTGFALGLPAAMAARVTQNTLYGLGDVKTPAKIALVRLAIVLIFSTFLMIQFDWFYISNDGIKILDQAPNLPTLQRVPTEIRLETKNIHLGPLGLALGSAIASWVEWFLLRRRLKLHLQDSVSSDCFKKVLLSALLSGIVMLGINLIDLPNPLNIAIIIPSGLAVYYLMLKKQNINMIQVLKS